VVVPTVFGPFVENYPKPTSRTDLVTNDFIYEIILENNGEYPQKPYSAMADVRDVAKAVGLLMLFFRVRAHLSFCKHVLSLTSPPSKENKRLLICSKFFKWKEAVELVREKRPELAHRLPRKDAIPPVQMSAPFDLSLTEKVLGLKEYIPWEETILAAIDEGLKLEQK